MDQIKDAVKNTNLRWLVLFLVSVVIGTNYYVYDAMSSIKSVMQAELGFSNQEYGFLISFYSFPNTWLLMAIFGGIILDKWGIKKTGFLTVALCSFGAFITAYGSTEYYSNGGFLYGIMDDLPFDYSPELKMLMLGRLFFGLGAETSIVVINKIMVKWFKGKELARAFAINIAIARIGTAAALIFSPISVGSVQGWNLALWLAAIIMGIGFVFFVIYMFFDSKVESTRLHCKDEEFHFSDIIKLLKNRSFIYVIFLCVTFYSAVFPFLAYVPDLLLNKFGVDLAENELIQWVLSTIISIFGEVSETQSVIIVSGFVSSLIPFGTIFFTPLFGAIVDKIGKRATLMILGSFLLIVSHLLLGLTGLSPYLSMFILGIAFSLVPASMWPSVAIIVEEKRLGTAYGIMGSLQNLGLWLFPILAGVILDGTNPGITPEMVTQGVALYDYTWTVLMFAGLGMIGIVFSLLLLRQEKGENNHGLEKP